MKIALYAAGSGLVSAVMNVPTGADAAAAAAQWGRSWVEAGDEVGPGWTFAGGAFTAPAATQAELVAALKRLRDGARATAPVTLEIGGEPVSLTIDTAPEDISALTGLVVAAQAGMATEPFAFKGGGQFFDLSAAQLTAVALAATQGVQRAYDAERIALAGVTGGTITDFAALEAAFAAALED